MQTRTDGVPHKGHIPVELVDEIESTMTSASTSIPSMCSCDSPNIRKLMIIIIGHLHYWMFPMIISLLAYYANLFSPKQRENHSYAAIIIHFKLDTNIKNAPNRVKYVIPIARSTVTPSPNPA